jgi:phosphatidylglycerophosphate synthase
MPWCLRALIYLAIFLPASIPLQAYTPKGWSIPALAVLSTLILAGVKRFDGWLARRRDKRT